MTPEEFIKDLAENGIKFDLNPTVSFNNKIALVRSYTEYQKRIDIAMRERAQKAIDNMPNASAPSDAKNEYLGVKVSPDAERYLFLCDGHGDFMSTRNLCLRSNDKEKADAMIDKARIKK